MSKSIAAAESRNLNGRIRKRAPNACERCRKQKVKCSGRVPCEQCSKRSIRCIFDPRQQKVLVSQSYLAELEKRAAVIAQNGEPGCSDALRQYDMDEARIGSDNEPGPATPRATSPTCSVHTSDQEASSESDRSIQNELRSTPVAGLQNPLDPANSDSFIVNHAHRRYYLGVSSNWSFGRRVHGLVHAKVNGAPLSSVALFFEGATYDLGWDGQRTSISIDSSSLPTADFALFLINAVKFHCGRLFHLFDEATFMHWFEIYYRDPGSQNNYPRLWYIHFLLILAFGKAFIVRASKGKRPPGADLFVQAMQLLPDVTFLYGDAVQAIEIYCCAALYLQCLDLRSAAYSTIGQAVRMAVEQGMHTDMRSLHFEEHVVQRCREIWWTVYVLDRQMTAMMGVPMSLSDDDITAPLPSFSGSASKCLALGLHVKLARANAVILQTVYGKLGGRSQHFLSSMKEALRTIAEANDERNSSFPLRLQPPTSGICRLSAYLHLFHHQALILATRPLLFSFLQARLDTTKALRVSSSRGGRSLVRVCVGSAQQSLHILEILQSQSLLESFVPFDREAAFSAAVVLVIAAVVDPSLVKDGNPRLDVACDILEEMASRGNLIADYQKRELIQLNLNLQKLEGMTSNETHEDGRQGQIETPESAESYALAPLAGQTAENDQQLPRHDLDNVGTLLSEWNSEDGLSGEHLIAVAESLGFDTDWPAMRDLDMEAGVTWT